MEAEKMVTPLCTQTGVTLLTGSLTRQLFVSSLLYTNRIYNTRTVGDPQHFEEFVCALNWCEYSCVVGDGSENIRWNDIKNCAEEVFAVEYGVAPISVLNLLSDKDGIVVYCFMYIVDFFLLNYNLTV